MTYTRYRRLSQIRAIDEDETIRAHFPDSGDQRADDFEIASFRCSFRGFVQQIKAGSGAGNSPVPLGKDAPVEYGRRKRTLLFQWPIGEKVCGFEAPVVDAIAGNAMKVETDVNSVSMTELKGPVDFF